jgi:rod shape-determining protein MreD
MRRRLAIVTVILVAVALQLAVVSRWRVGGIAPDLVVLAVAGIAVRCGSETGALAGFGAGLLVDLFLPTPAGLTALAYTLVGYGVGLVAAGVLESTWWTGPAVGAVAAFGAGALYALLGGLFGQSQLMTARVLVIVPLAALLSGVIALVVVPSVRWIVPPPRQARTDPW